MLHSTPHLSCKTISCPNSARCALRNSYRYSVMCQLLFHLNRNWNINKFYKLPNIKIQWKSVQGLEFLYADTYRQTGILKLRDILLQNFITNMSKKLSDLSWKCYQALFSVVEQMKSMPNLPNKCSREN